MYRYVYVAADRAFLHLTVADVEVFEYRFQSFEVDLRLSRAFHIRLGNNLDKRHAAAVEVYERRTVEFIGVEQLARVLFDMYTGNAYPAHFAV